VKAGAPLGVIVKERPHCPTITSAGALRL
jgi:hypothetical protein